MAVVDAAMVLIASEKKRDVTMVAENVDGLESIEDLHRAITALGKEES
jgi:hypothetical protein